MNNNINSSSSVGYEMRGSGDGRSKKQSMAELKLRRLQELNVRLKEDLDRRRIPVSEAANDLIAFTDKEPKDYMVPSRWGTVCEEVDAQPQDPQDAPIPTKECPIAAQKSHDSPTSLLQKSDDTLLDTAQEDAKADSLIASE